MPNIKKLDGQEVSFYEKVKSDILFGADVEKSKEIFEQYLPDEQFVDRRLFVAEQIDPESDSEEERDLFENDLKPTKLSKHNTHYTSKNVTSIERKKY